jgi:endoglucanase
MVLKHAPHWLILVGGLDFQGDFLAVANSPLKIASMHKLVYTGHLYSWSWNKYGVNMNNIDYNEFRQRFFDTQTYVRGMGIPFMLGEFGDNNNSNYWNHLIKYLEESDIDWTYWCVDGYKYDGTSDKEVD